MVVYEPSICLLSVKCDASGQRCLLRISYDPTWVQIRPCLCERWPNMISGPSCFMVVRQHAQYGGIWVEIFVLPSTLVDFLRLLSVLTQSDCTPPWVAWDCSKIKQVLSLKWFANLPTDLISCYYADTPPPPPLHCSIVVSWMTIAQIIFLRSFLLKTGFHSRWFSLYVEKKQDHFTNFVPSFICPSLVVCHLRIDMNISTHKNQPSLSSYIDYHSGFWPIAFTEVSGTTIFVWYFSYRNLFVLKHLYDVSGF